MESDKRDVHDVHLDETTLARFADGNLRGRAAARARAHLRSCPACRREVQILRAISAAIRAVPAPRPPQGLFDEIYPEPPRAAPVIPLAVPRGQVAGFPRRLVLTAAAGLAVVVAAVVLLTVRPDRVMAGASTLSLEWEMPGTLALEYQTPSGLAAEPSLRARMRYWVPDPNRFAQTEPGYATVELSREAPGLFSGSVALPPGTVYAVAVVEDVDGDHIDTDFGRFWEYLETDPEGQPTLQARRHQLLATSELSVSRAAEVAEEAALQFPEQPEFWVRQLLFTQGAVPPDSLDAFLREHADRFVELDRIARAGTPDPVELDALHRYASLLDRPELASYWSEQLVRRYPRHGAAALVRLRAINRSPATMRRKLDDLEDSWARAAAPATAQVGLRLSIELVDPVLATTWLDRHSAVSVFRDLTYDTEIARELVAVAALWPIAEAWILDRIAENRDEMGPQRPLDQSRRNSQAEATRRRARLNLYLARLRLARGQLQDAVDVAERAVQQAWSPEIFLEAAEIHRAAGAVTRSDELFALASVDPMTSLAPTPQADGSGPFTRSSDNRLADARVLMYERVTSTLLDEHIDLNARLRSATGEEFPLRALVGGELVLLLHTSQPNFVSDEAFSLLEANSDRLRSAGIQTVLVAQRLDPLAQKEPGFRSSFYEDVELEAWDSLRAWREVQYFVLDANRLRYRGEDLEVALRISLVLSTREDVSLNVESNRKDVDK